MYNFMLENVPILKSFTKWTTNSRKTLANLNSNFAKISILPRVKFATKCLNLEDKYNLILEECADLEKLQEMDDEL
jgi:hypothetical protein